jgi:putative heme-binding domain-containing protein
LTARLIVAFIVALGPVAARTYGQSNLDAAEPTEQKPLKPLPKFLKSAKLAERYLSTRDIAEVLEFERTEPVCDQILKRPGVSPRQRLEAALMLAEIHQTDVAAVLIDRIQHAGEPNETVQDRVDEEVLGDLAHILPGLDARLLARYRSRIAEMAGSERPSPARPSALIALAVADGSAESAWHIAKQSDERLVELLSSLSSITDDRLRAEFFPRVSPLIGDGSSPAVQIAAIQSIVHLKGDMAPLFRTLTDLVLKRRHVDACVGAIGQLPESAWDMDRIEPLANKLIEYVQELTLADRSGPRGRQVLTLIQKLASRLPDDRRQKIVFEANRLTVQSFTIRALPEKMAYDVTVIVVEAGRPVQINFHNDDIMPHNLVIGSEPAARRELGLMADQMQSLPDALAKGYVPASDKLLVATRLIQPGQADSIEFVLPDTGVFPFVCTFPGHWNRMYGAVKVVSDREAYLSSVRPWPSADDLLGIRTVAWKYEDLAAELDQLQRPRSFSNGERLFREASCFSCHRVRGQGGTIGPDLTEINKKYKLPAEVLSHIMEPSKSIDDAYASVSVLDSKGRVHQGVVLRRTETELFLQPSPLGKCDPTIIRLDDIEEETKSKVSAMPEKLLNAILTKSEVYDLIAYLMTGGDPADPIFVEPVAN